MPETESQDTYESLLSRCIRTSLKMKSDGLTENDIVCLCTYNHCDSFVPFIAASFLSIKIASLDPTLSVADVSYLLNQVKPAIIFFVPESVELIEQSLQETDFLKPKLVVFGETDTYEPFSNYLVQNSDEAHFKPVHTKAEDTAVIFFSSGTTGFPKGICQNSYALLAQAFNVMYVVLIVILLLLKMYVFLETMVG